MNVDALALSGAGLELFCLHTRNNLRSGAEDRVMLCIALLLPVPTSPRVNLYRIRYSICVQASGKFHKGQGMDGEGKKCGGEGDG